LQPAIHHCQINSLKASIPDLEPDSAKIPCGAKDLGNGYVILRSWDKYAQKLPNLEATAVKAYFQQETSDVAANWVPRVKRWACLCLPNGQIGRSGWKEKNKSLKQVQMAQNVKVSSRHISSTALIYSTQLLLQDQIQFAKVNYYFQAQIQEEERTLALITLYSTPNEHLLHLSHNALLICTCQPNSMIVVDVHALQSVVAMVPFQQIPGRENTFFVVEKLGLEVSDLGGDQEVVVQE
jgi:hypothetical protein